MSNFVAIGQTVAKDFFDFLKMAAAAILDFKIFLHF